MPKFSIAGFVLLTTALLTGWLVGGGWNAVTAQTNQSAVTPANACHYEIVGVSGTATFLLNPCTADSWYYDSGISYSGADEPATWKRIVKE